MWSPIYFSSIVDLFRRKELVSTFHDLQVTSEWCATRLECHQVDVTSPGKINLLPYNTTVFYLTETCVLDVSRC